MTKTILLDGNALMHRSFHAVKFSPIYEGKPIGMVFGFASTLLQTIDKFGPTYFITAFDTKEKTFRHEMFPEYKGQRSKAPDEFYDQIPLIHKLLEAFDIPLLRKPGFEADDIIGTLARQYESNSHVFILSGDLDFLQLINPQITLAKFNGSEPLLFDQDKTFEKLGIYPNQVIDYKAICGDSSDNYKGIPGVGPKTTVDLLTQYKTLDNILQNIPQLKATLETKFLNHREDALFCQKLATIKTDVPLPLKTKTPYAPNYKKIIQFLESLNLKALSNRAHNLGKKSDQDFFYEQPIDSSNHNQGQASFGF